MVQVDLSEVRELPNGTRIFVKCVGSEWYFEDTGLGWIQCRVRIYSDR